MASPVLGLHLAGGRELTSLQDLGTTLTSPPQLEYVIHSPRIPAFFVGRNRLQTQGIRNGRGRNVGLREVAIKDNRRVGS